MAWVRIHDGAMTHPKVIGLSDKAFRLWIWGLSYSQQHLTNGLIPRVAIPARVARATADLLAARLWDDTPAGGYQVHDYLDWNDSRDVVVRKRTDARDRMAQARDRRSTPRPADRFESCSQTDVRANTSQRTSDEVLRRVGLEEQSLREKVSPRVIASDDLGERAAGLISRYESLYRHHRKGAKLLRMRPSLDFDAALRVCGAWDDARLDKLAGIFLTTDDQWISGTDRNFQIFASKASWCDDRLTEWEAKNRATA
jgi:hypothetical protein